MATSPNREISATLVRPCVQNDPQKIGGASRAGYTHEKAAQLWTRWRDYVSNLAWSRFGVEPAELSEVIGISWPPKL